MQISQQVIQSLLKLYALQSKNNQKGEGLNSINSDLLNPLPKEVEPETDPLIFGAIISHKSSEHDKFDHSSIISKLPKAYQERATKRLEVFDNHPSQLTFNETGTLFINGNVISQSNFFNLLPHLFSHKPKTFLPGFNQLVTQICSIGYGKLINGTLMRGLHRTKQIENGPQIMKDLKKNWYYLGT